ncbi:MAG: 3-ketoacyl-ACP reductase [Bacteroidia bacterium]
MSKIALVTGGSRGIGLGIAQYLAAEGWDLAINGVREESSVTQVLENLRTTGVKVIYCQGNVGEAADRKNMMAKVRSELGGLNMLVNNAGVAPKERKDILETTEESYDYVMDINLKGTYFLCQAAANWLVEQKIADAAFWGCIVNVSSISATVASVNRGEYCVSKAGMSMVTQLFATRLGEYDLPVYEVRPGVIMTDMTGGVKEKYDKLIADGLSVQKRWGFPEDVGKTVAMLARRDMPFSTGQVLMVDGGLTLSRL